MKDTTGTEDSSIEVSGIVSSIAALVILVNVTLFCAKKNCKGDKKKPARKKREPNGRDIVRGTRQNLPESNPTVRLEANCGDYVRGSAHNLTDTKSGSALPLTANSGDIARCIKQSLPDVHSAEASHREIVRRANQRIPEDEDKPCPKVILTANGREIVGGAEQSPVAVELSQVIIAESVIGSDGSDDEGPYDNANLTAVLGGRGVGYQENAPEANQAVVSNTGMTEYTIENELSPAAHSKNALEHRKHQTETTEEYERMEQSQEDMSNESHHQQTDKPKNMNTIKQAKVNVRNRVSFFKDTNAPLMLDKRRTPNRYRTSVITDDLERHSTAGTHQRTAPSTELLVSHQDKEQSGTSTVKGVLLHQNATHSHSPILINYPTGRSPEEVQRPIDQTTTETTNEKIMDGGWSPTEGRMDTLKYFSKVTRDHSLLKGFEKAKPARNQRKEDNGRGFQRPQRPGGRNHGAKNRHSEMPTITSWDSDPDMVACRGESDEQSDDSLDTTVLNNMKNDQDRLNNKTGQIYAMDDSAYETISRRKKIAGERLAVGGLDKETERNFLNSLKRNIQMKARKRSSVDDIGDMIF